MSKVLYENPYGGGTFSGSDSWKDAELASVDKPGAVKMAAAVADVADAPTAAEFNALLAALRAAGIMAASEEE